MGDTDISTTIDRDDAKGSTSLGLSPMSTLRLDFSSDLLAPSPPEKENESERASTTPVRSSNGSEPATLSTSMPNTPLFYGILAPPTPTHLPRSHFSRRYSVSAAPHVSSQRRRSLQAVELANVNAKYNVPNVSESYHHETAKSIIRQFFCQHLPALFSPRPIRSLFARRLDVAIRATLSFLIAAVIATQSWAITILAVPYLFTVFATVTVRMNVGATIALIESQSKGLLAAAVIDVILLAVGVPKIANETNRIITVEVLLFVSSMFLAYIFTAPLARRFGLAMHGLVMVQMATDPNTSIYFPVQMLFNLILGYVLSLLFCLIPFPRLASDELLDRFQLTLVSLSKCFTAVTRAYLSTEPIAPHILRSDVRAELESVFGSLTQMRRLAGEAKCESAVWYMLFPLSISVGSPVKADVDRCEQLYWIVANLMHTITSLRYSSYHAAFVEFLTPSLLAFDEAQSAYLTLLASREPAMITLSEIERCKNQLNSAMNDVQAGYLQARKYVYGYDSNAMQTRAQEKKLREAFLNDAILHQHHAHHEAATISKAEVLPSDLHRQRSNPSVIAEEEEASLPMNGHGQDSRPKLSATPSLPSRAVSLYHSTDEVFVRSAFFFYVTRFHHVLIVLEISTPHTLQTRNDRVRAGRSAESRQAFMTRKWRAIRSLVREHLAHPWQWSLLGMHPLNDFLWMIRHLGHLVRYPSVDWLWLRAAAKIGLIMCTTSLISVIPSVVRSGTLPNSVWAVFTAGILASDTEGALWQRGMHRLFGTLIGGLVGYLVLLAFAESWVGAIALMCIWNVPMMFVQFSSFGYLGALASFTVIVIVYGFRINNPTHLSTAEYSLARMVEILIGVAIALGISFTLWPTSSIRLLRSEIVVGIEAMQNGIAKSVEIYDRIVNRDERKRQEISSAVVLPTLSPSPALPTASAATTNENASNVELTTITKGNESAAVSDTSTPALEFASAPSGTVVDVNSVTISISSELDDEDTLLRSLMSATHSVQMSLSRQARLLGEAVYEPSSFFQQFPVHQYKELAMIVRRLWCFIITLEPSLRQISLHSDQRDLLHLRDYHAALRSMIGDVDVVLSECTGALKRGELPQCPELDSLTQTAQSMQANFAASMNSMARQVRHGKLSLVPSEFLIPTTVFLYASLEASQQVLVLEQAVRRLIRLEQPPGYDD